MAGAARIVRGNRDTFCVHCGTSRINQEEGGTSFTVMVNTKVVLPLIFVAVMV